MEFTTLDAARQYATRAANLLVERRHVLCGSGSKPYWVCSDVAKRELWPDRVPVLTVDADVLVSR